MIPQHETKSCLWLEQTCQLITTTRFFDHDWPEHRDDQKSCVNKHEAEMIVGFVKYLMHNGFRLPAITLLVYYNGQRREIMSQLRASTSLDLRERMNELTIKTVDSYQGEENEVVILSLVRSNLNESIGFLDDVNRICVALSRARRGFYLFGNSQLLRRGSSVWRAVYNIMRFGDDVVDAERFGKQKMVLGRCSEHNRRITITSQ